MTVGEGESVTPTAAEIGLQLRAVVMFVDGDGVPEQVVSEVTGPVADDPALGGGTGGTTDPGTGGGTPTPAPEAAPPTPAPEAAPPTRARAAPEARS